MNPIATKMPNGLSNRSAKSRGLGSPLLRSWALAAALFLAAANPGLVGAKSAKKPCAPSLAQCPDDGCGKKFDPNLNRRKNIRADSQTPTPRTLTWIKNLEDPENFEERGTRGELADLGEGQTITVVGYLLVARRGSPESCNCGLSSAPDTDNHLVLVTKKTLQKYPLGRTALANKNVLRRREKESVTAEFTPRVRWDHPNFTRTVIQPLIDDAPQQALLVRVTGLLMFDSEHFIRNALKRETNWEIHPVLKLEFCRSGGCTAADDVGWTSLDSLP